MTPRKPSAGKRELDAYTLRQLAHRITCWLKTDAVLIKSAHLRCDWSEMARYSWRHEHNELWRDSLLSNAKAIESRAKRKGRK